ncbi:MAG: PilZ domain-containing protein, partial [Pyrinomonadaceae bacterium]|nr:PilZ domain-containing protein [Pyrinomonadaceae bacterium]
MPEFLRSIVNSLREHVGNRRAAPRYTTHLDVALILSVSLSEAGSKARSENSPLRLAGYTRDISETGLALIVPAIHIGGQYLNSPNRILEITLRLPSGPIQLQAAPVRYSPLDEDARDTGYIIGVQITQMNERDRAHYNA